jgi:myosin-18
VSNQDEELEDVRAAFQKKLKIVEQQLENEHEDRLNFLREKHELETKIITLQELAARSADEEQVYLSSKAFNNFLRTQKYFPLKMYKLKRDLKRTKALLRDAQFMLEKSKLDSSNKVIIRQLKNQVI